MTGEMNLEEFLRELNDSRREVEIARQQFDFVMDPLLIDHLVFRLGAAEKHFSYMIQLARKMNLSAAEEHWRWQVEKS